MDKVDRETLWARRPNSSKLSLSMNQSEQSDSRPDQPSRSFSSSKRWGPSDSSSHGRQNPFNAITPLTTTGISSPASAATSAFGLGSGAFASFGSAAKTPKTPGTAFDFGKAVGAGSTPSTPIDKPKSTTKAPAASTKGTPQPEKDTTPAAGGPATESGSPWSLKYTWVIWYRPPTSKNSDYEKSTKAMCKMATAQQFWAVYSHLKPPSQLPAVSDYHFFREGIRPVWEDEENKKGGKWIMRLKKGVCDRYWEDLLMAMIGDQFAEAADEVCGAVLSVRSGEDVFSIWTKNDGGRNIKIRETIKRVLALPADTNIVWKSHDDSIAQRTLIDQQRQEKSGHHGETKRRVTLSSNDESSTLVRERLSGNA